MLSKLKRPLVGLIFLLLLSPFIGRKPADATSTSSLYFNVNASDSGSYSSSTPTRWTDLAGGRIGNVVGSLTFDNTNKALTFPGGTNSFNSLGYVDMGSGLDNFSTGLTIEFEGHFGNANQSWERIFDFGNGAGVDNIWVGVAGVGAANRLALEIWNETLSPKNLPGRCVSPANSLVTNQFAKWVITLDGTTCRMYKNGAEVNVERIDGGYGGTLSGPSLGASYPYLPRIVTRTKNYIGLSNWGLDPAFDGAIKYVRIYTAALSGTDITNNSTTYTLTYATTDSDSGMAPNARTGNGLITLDGNSGNLTKTGYTFGGWTTTAGSSTAVSGTFNLTSNTTLHPVWTANTYTVSYDVHGGSSVSTGSYSTGSTITLPSAPTRNGYTFDGWFLAASGGTALGGTYAPPGTGAITLHAQWTVNSYTVTYDEQGGSSVSNGTFTHNGSLTFPAAPTRAGYTFNGWFAAPSGGNALTASDVATGNASVTLYAQWTANPTTTTTTIAPTTTTTSVAANTNASNTNPTTVQPGQTVTLTLGGFLPNEPVHVRIDAIGVNEKLVASQKGQVRLKVKFTESNKNQTVTVRAVSASTTVTQQLQVAASSRNLPTSGSSTWPLLFFASLALLFGHLSLHHQRQFSR